MNNILSYGDFEKIINGIKREVTFQDKVYYAFRELDGDYYRDTPSVDMMIMLLDKIFCDDSDYPLIDYWIYELDFGKKWKPGCVMDNGAEVKLETVSDLYDALVKQKAEMG